MRYNYSYILTITAALVLIPILAGCGECDLVTADYPCRIREATITKFDPRLIKHDDSTYVPVPEYSIHTFQFPADNSSSGILTNDNRFDQSGYMEQFVTIAEEKFSIAGEDFRALLVSSHPPNSVMIGDIMVIDADPASSPPSARLRCAGYLAKFPVPFLSEDAFKFCDEYLRNYRKDDEDFSQLSSKSSKYGEGLANSSSSKLTVNDVIVLDQNNKDVTANRRQEIPPETLDRLLSAKAGGVTDISVLPGEVYYYKAINGKEFALVIADVRQGSFEPYLKRVTIKFSEIRGQKTTQCPDIN